jgi:hypothetical protein
LYISKQRVQDVIGEWELVDADGEWGGDAMG